MDWSSMLNVKTRPHPPAISIGSKIGMILSIHNFSLCGGGGKVSGFSVELLFHEVPDFIFNHLYMFPFFIGQKGKQIP